MTALLYIAFYAWLLGVVFFTGLFAWAVKMFGGRESFTDVFNKTQGRNFPIHHIEWAIVLATIFWPNTIASMILSNAGRRHHDKPVDK